MTKQEALEYVKRLVDGCIPSRHPDYERLQGNLAVAVDQIWTAAQGEGYCAAEANFE